MIKFLRKILKNLIACFRNLTPHGRRENKLDKINGLLADAVIAQNKEKNALKRRILKHFNTNARSKYIRPKGKSRHHIRTECNRLFGEEMTAVNLELTDDLRFK